MKKTTVVPPLIPDKIYFRIGEVSDLIGVDTHVLRYWETEFSIIKPFRGKSKQRLYRKQDIENLFCIKKLLHDEGFTIPGARKYIKTKSLNEAIKRNAEEVSDRPVNNENSILMHIKRELRSILEQLDNSQNLNRN